MSTRARALLYLVAFLALLTYIGVRVIVHGDRPGCGAAGFLLLFAMASLTSFIRAKAAEPPPPPDEPGR
jgi:hypothetical protein